MIHSASSHEAQQDSWFVIWTESRAEKKVEARIAALGLSPWLPTVKERHRWSDRWREVVCPLFPGYLFARTRSVEWHKVLRTPGVLTVVKREGRPALLADGFIAGLRDAIERNGAAPEPVVEMVDYGPGDEVVIVQEGALKGVRGVVRERRSGRQLVIWVSEIGRGVAFTIGPALVKAAGQSRRLIPSSSAVQASRVHFTRARNLETPETARISPKVRPRAASASPRIISRYRSPSVSNSAGSSPLRSDVSGGGASAREGSESCVAHPTD